MGISKVRPSAELGTISVSYAIRVLARVFEAEAAIAVENLLNEYNNIKEERKKDKHALWMARALRAEEHTFIHAPKRDKWEWAERKCREKAEEYK